MSKYIPTDNKPSGQVKSKLKVKVVMDGKETFLNEYDAFQMISELKQQMAQVTQAVQGIMDAMSAATSDVSLANTPPVQQSSAPSPTTLKLPKLNHVGDSKTVKGDLEGGEKKYYNSSGEVKLES